MAIVLFGIVQTLQRVCQPFYDNLKNAHKMNQVAWPANIVTLAFFTIRFYIIIILLLIVWD